ncbi:MAG: 2-oxoacid:ferredoxin oxidoreductase subunit beta [Chloroflexota bacterium]
MLDTRIVPEFKFTSKSYDGEREITWCPGCGDYGIIAGVKQALAQLQIPPHQAYFVSGIGCGSKLPDYLKANGYLGLHGRTLPIAQGVKIANHDLKVIVTVGDGDSFGIGAGHFVHALRRNSDITMIVEDNKVYALTKGQYSPASTKGWISSTTPDGSIEVEFNPVLMAIAGGATFVARTFSGDPKHMTQTFAKAIQHKGFAIVDVLQVCVIYNHVNTTEWYRPRVYKLDEDASYNPRDYHAAMQKAQEWGDQIPIGVFYLDERPTYESQVAALTNGALVKQPMAAYDKATWGEFRNSVM